MILSVLLFVSCGSIATVTGNLTYKEQIVLPPDAMVNIKLQKMLQTDEPAVTIAEQTIENPSQIPVHFNIKYNPPDIDGHSNYILNATVTYDGKVRFINAAQCLVITHGKPIHLDISLKDVS